MKTTAKRYFRFFEVNFKQSKKSQVFYNMPYLIVWRSNLSQNLRKDFKQDVYSVYKILRNKNRWFTRNFRLKFGCPPGTAKFICAIDKFKRTIQPGKSAHLDTNLQKSCKIVSKI